MMGMCELNISVSLPKGLCMELCPLSYPLVLEWIKSFLYLDLFSGGSRYHPSSGSGPTLDMGSSGGGGADPFTGMLIWRFMYIPYPYTSIDRWINLINIFGCLWLNIGGSSYRPAESSSSQVHFIYCVLQVFHYSIPVFHSITALHILCFLKSMSWFLYIKVTG